MRNQAHVTRKAQLQRCCTARMRCNDAGIAADADAIADIGAIATGAAAVTETGRTTAAGTVLTVMTVGRAARRKEAGGRRRRCARHSAAINTERIVGDNDGDVLGGARVNTHTFFVGNRSYTHNDDCNVSQPKQKTKINSSQPNRSVSIFCVIPSS